MIPIITRPTRIADNTYSLIDNIFTSNPFNYVSGIFHSDISDHFPIFVLFKDYFSPNNHEHLKFNFRLITDSRLLEMKNKLNSMNLYAISEMDCNAALEKIHRTIKTQFDIYCPIKRKIVSYKDNLKPWITSEVKNNM